MIQNSFEHVVTGARLALDERTRVVIAGRAGSFLVAYLAGVENGADRVLIAGAEEMSDGVAMHQAWSWATSQELQVRMRAEPLNSTLGARETAALGELMNGRLSTGAEKGVVLNALVLPDSRTPVSDPYILGTERFHHITPAPASGPDTFMGQQIVRFVQN